MSMLDSCKSSGKQSADADITTAPTLVYGVVLTNGGGACSVILTDGSGGTDLFSLADAGTTANVQQSAMFSQPVVFSSGVSINITGTSAYCYVLYQVYGS